MTYLERKKWNDHFATGGPATYDLYQMYSMGCTDSVTSGYVGGLMSENVGFV